ncbi:homeobox domain-containing protein [Parasitella parasitica]|nr:homeobox domain-containing protein [Parasitella parasitica]
MQFWQSSSAESNQKNATTPSTIGDRRSSLAISALLNDVSVDPVHHPLALDISSNLPWHGNMKSKLPPYHTDYSPISSGASSPNSSLDSFGRQSSITGPLLPPPPPPPDLWSHSRTGMHQTNNGIIVSSLAKAKRKRILPHQYERLTSTFEITDTPSSEIRSRLAEELDMTKREVQVWFQNRRAK